ncbi:MAG: helix-turn-helix domain-containing protein, partial [Planctomycetaceae bacterium]|nr:helix-turn-helix domain-containing protein [Planctomycetaceae bacterium]
MVRAFHAGQSLRAVAERFGVSVSFVRRWVQRAGVQRLDRVDWSDHRTTRDQTHNRTSSKIECCILRMRKKLKTKS